MLEHVLAVVFLVISMYFAWRSFYRMRIGGTDALESEVTEGVAA